ncbi:MAG: undecaprenyl-diphosphate phosphatase [Gemmatimonadota bacterium]|jgi:undecaprenyl-diphosphatase
MDPIIVLKAAVLGVVEGVTEFLPISSTGHLIIVGDWLRFTGEQAKTFDIVIQLGAILAVVWLYREKISRVVRTLPASRTSRHFAINLVVAFIPAAVVGLLTHDWITAHLFNPFTVAGALVAGGIVILVIEAWAPRTLVRDVDAIPVWTALGIGLAQVLSLVPGTSRAGATIMGAYALGCSRRAATEFSFFLAIPVMFAATLFDLWISRHLLTAADVPVLVVGFVVSFLAAVVVVRLFLRFVSGHTFKSFAWYRIGFGGLLLLYYLLG